ncbi:hypothetical protein D3C86_882640 [compost metagenome]
MGSSASGSLRASSSRANFECACSHFCSGAMRLNHSGLVAMEISAPASTRLCPSTGSRPSDTPSPARMNENSPICARLALTVSAVASG